MNSSTQSNRRLKWQARLAGFGLVALATVAARAGTTTTPFSPGSPPGAPFPGHTYRVIVDPKATWAQANADATALGGWLVTIDSTAEQEFVQTLLVKNKVASGAYWLGLEKLPTGKYVWSSKQKDTPVYTHWLPREPNNLQHNEKYASILWDTPQQPASLQPRAGFWNDLPLAGYRLGQRTATADLVVQGYIVEMVAKGKAKVAVSSGHTVSPAVGGGTSAGTASSVPLPAAVFLVPLGMGLAGYAARKMGRKAD